MTQPATDTTHSFVVRSFRFAVGLSLALACLQLATTPLLTLQNPHFPLPIDHHKYLFLAQHNPLSFHVAPYCHRVLGPLLTHLLPFSLASNFLLIACVSVALTGIGIYRLALAEGHSSEMALLGIVLLFTLGWATRYVLYDFWLPDALAFCLTTWDLVLLRERRTVAFSALLCIGVLVKESVLMVAPLVWLLGAGKQDRGLCWWQGLLLLLPALLALTILHTLIPTYNGDVSYMRSLPVTLRFVQPGLHGYSLRELFTLNGMPRLQHLSWPSLQRYAVGTFGVAALCLPLLALRNNLRQLAAYTPVLLLSYAQILFAFNVERLVVAAAPVVVLAALNGLAAARKSLRLPMPVTALIPGAFVLLNLFSHTPTQAPLSWQLSTLALLSTLLAIYAYRSARERNRGIPAETTESVTPR